MGKRLNDRDQKELDALVRKVLVEIVVPYLVYVLREVFGRPGDVLRNLKKVLADTSGQLGIVISAAGAAGGAAGGAALWAAGLGFWGSIGYSLGLISLPLWAPLAGAAVGLAAGVGGSM